MSNEIYLIHNRWRRNSDEPVGYALLEDDAKEICKNNKDLIYEKVFTFKME